MRQPSLRPVLGPAALCASAFALQALAPGAATVAGVAAWLGLAWTAARVFDLLLLRAAWAARRPLPYPRLLGDLVRGACFGAAGIAILLLVFDRPALGLVTTSGVAIAVIGFALRNIISDLFSGLALGIDAPYRIGDWIETAEGSAGRVTELSWRTTRLVTRDGVAVVVPNGLIAAHRLVNWGAGEGGRYRATLRVTLDAGLPPARARRLLLAAALDAGRRWPGLAPDVLLQDLAEGQATWLLRFGVADHGREAATRDGVAEAVLRALQGAGIAPAGPLRALRRAPATAAPDAAALLGGLPLFHDFSAAERQELAAAMRPRTLPAGTAVVREGEPGESLFVLAEGALEVRVAAVEAAVDLLLPGAVFGEMSLLTGQPRSSTVLAASEAVVFEIGRAQLDPILRRRPALAEGLAAMMAARQAHNAAARLPAGAAGPQPAARGELLRRLRIFFSLEHH